MKIIYGLYNKRGDDKTLLMQGLLPSGFKSIEINENDFEKTFEFFRRDFSMVTNYHGWYCLIPKKCNIVRFLENNVAPLNSNQLKKEVVISHDNEEYDLYANFGVAKTSNTWKLKIVIY